MSKINLNDIPYGDCYNIIWIDKKCNVGALLLTVPYNNGEYHEYSWKDIIDEVMKASNNKAIHFIMVAEFGLSGIVYRWSSSGIINKVGKTRGYA